MNEQKESEVLKEIAKSTPRILDSVDKLGGYLAKTFELPIKEATELLAEIIGLGHDQISRFRLRNIAMILEKHEEIVKKKNLAIKYKLSAKNAYKFLRESSLEDEDELQDMWANLFANSHDESQSSNSLRYFMSILSDLEVLDAILLEHMYDLGAFSLTSEFECKYNYIYNSFAPVFACWKLGTTSIGGNEISPVIDEYNEGRSPDEQLYHILYLSLLNLISKGLVHDTRRIKLSRHVKSEEDLLKPNTIQNVYQNGDDTIFCISQLGASLIKKCTMKR